MLLMAAVRLPLVYLLSWSLPANENKHKGISLANILLMEQLYNCRGNGDECWGQDVEGVDPWDSFLWPWYRYAPHYVSVNNRPHARRWSHNIIPLCYNCLQYSVQ
jgi:hypothetical protein